MGKEPPVLLKMRWAHINRSTHRNLAHTLHITPSLQDSFAGFTIDWILAPRKVRDFENALRRLPSGSPGFIWGLNLWIEPATKLPGDSLLRQPVDTEARLFFSFVGSLPLRKKKRSKTKKLPDELAIRWITCLMKILSWNDPSRRLHQPVPFSPPN